MPRLLPLFILALACAGIAIGCGKKEEPEAGGGVPEPPVEDKGAAVERLDRIAKAVFVFAEGGGWYLPGVVGPNGRLGLSWRVALLPSLGEDGLYREFKLTEPWDSEHNKKLIARMPKVFETGAPAGQTHIRSFVGPQAITRAGLSGSKGLYDPWHNQPAGQWARGQTFLSVSDGAIYTLFAAEAADPVEWTKPDELVLADQPGGPPQPLPKLGGRFAGGFHGLMGDGRVFFFPDSLGEAEVRKLITADAGDTPGPEVAAMLAYPAKAGDADTSGKGGAKGKGKSGTPK